MQNFNPENEVEAKELRKQTVSRFVSDVAEGRVSLAIDYQSGRRPEDVEMISNTVSKLILHLNDYVAGTKAGEEFDFMERQLFFCISVLKTYNAFKTNLDESKLETCVLEIASKVDSNGKKIDEILEKLRAPPPKPKRSRIRKTKK